MILDLNTLLSGSLGAGGVLNGQAITADAVSQNVLDLGATGVIPYGGAAIQRDLGKCNHVPLLIQVVEDFSDLTSLTVSVEYATDEAFTSPVELTKQTVAVASLKKGFIFAIDKFPRDIKGRYVRLKYDVTGTNPTAGKVIAGVVGSVA